MVVFYRPEFAGEEKIDKKPNGIVDKEEFESVISKNVKTKKEDKKPNESVDKEGF